MVVETKTGPKGKKVTLGIDQLVNLYDISNQAEGKSPKTVRWYTEMLGAFARYLAARHVVSVLNAFNMDTVRAYILYLRDKKRFEGHPYTPQQDRLLSAKTIQCHVRALKAFSSWLYAEGKTAENRLKNLKLPKAPSVMQEPLTPEEIKSIIGSIDKKSSTGDRNRAIFVTLLDSGLRASEVAGITLGNLNLEDGFIKVMGKGSKERVVPIGEHVRMILWGYIDKVRHESAALSCNNLFLSHDGRPITVNTVKLIFSKLAKSSGVKRLHAHLCRHTFAVNYLLNGGDVFSLREILGHTTLEMVNHYVHFTSSQITAQHHKYSPIDKLYGKVTGSMTKSPIAKGK